MIKSSNRRFAPGRRTLTAMITAIAALGIVLLAMSADVAALVAAHLAPAVEQPPTPSWLQPEFSPDRGYQRKTVAYEHMYRSERGRSRR